MRWLFWHDTKLKMSRAAAAPAGRACAVAASWAAAMLAAHLLLAAPAPLPRREGRPRQPHPVGVWRGVCGGEPFMVSFGPGGEYAQLDGGGAVVFTGRWRWRDEQGGRVEFGLDRFPVFSGGWQVSPGVVWHWDWPREGWEQRRPLEYVGPWRPR